MHKWNTKSPQLRREWIVLQPGDSLLLRGARGLRVDAASSPCLAEQAPLLWLTEENERDDVFLRPGDCHVLRSNGRMVATAWGPISLRVVKATVRVMSDMARTVAGASALDMVTALAPSDLGTSDRQVIDCVEGGPPNADDGTGAGRPTGMRVGSDGAASRAFCAGVTSASPLAISPLADCPVC